VNLKYYLAVVVCPKEESVYVGLGAEDATKLCPPDIEVACHNGPNFCTLSGPAESMKKFVKELQERGVFAKEVNCGNIAYHSKYISAAGPLLLKYLKQVECVHYYLEALLNKFNT
jgi:acyl transferase domain-containing protein